MKSAEQHIYTLSRLFDGIRLSERKLVDSSERLLRFHLGEVIAEEGRVPHYIYCVAEGRVKIYRQGFDRPQILRFLGRGDCFGYHEAFDGGVRRISATVSAISEVELIALPISVFRTIATENSHVAFNMFRDTNELLRKMTNLTVGLTQKHLRGRVADMILQLIDTYGRDLNTGVLRCAIPRADMANMANMTTPNVIRTLRSFRDEGLIRISGRTIVILNYDGLVTISAQG